MRKIDFNCSYEVCDLVRGFYGLRPHLLLSCQRPVHSKGNKNKKIV